MVTLPPAIAVKQYPVRFGQLDLRAAGKGQRFEVLPEVVEQEQTYVGVVEYNEVMPGRYLSRAWRGVEQGVEVAAVVQRVPVAI